MGAAFIAVRAALAFAAALGVTYLLATAFYTQQIVSGYAAIGASLSAADMWTTFMENLSGLSLLAIIYGIGLLIGFAVAWVLKKVLRPLAPMAYPLAGAVAVVTAIILIESQLGGGAGVIGGARTTLGMALQGLAGAVGGFVFAILRPVND